MAPTNLLKKCFVLAYQLEFFTVENLKGKEPAFLPHLKMAALPRLSQQMLPLVESTLMMFH